MLKPDRIIVERRPDRVYDQLFPYYVELCATSQFRSKLKGEGGVAGHAVMYIKGACKDEQASFPQLRRCRVAATELSDPEHGAGVSVGGFGCVLGSLANLIALRLAKLPNGLREFHRLSIPFLLVCGASALLLRLG